MKEGEGEKCVRNYWKQETGNKPLVEDLEVDENL